MRSGWPGLGRADGEGRPCERCCGRIWAGGGRAQLPELLLAIDGETHFTWELLGRAPSSPEELVPVYAAILVAAPTTRGRRAEELTAPRFSIEALRPIGPVGHRHINFRGTYRFPIERYAERLVQSAA